MHTVGVVRGRLDFFFSYSKAETTFMASCLLPWMTFENGIFFLFPLKLDPYLGGGWGWGEEGKHENDRLASLERVNDTAHYSCPFIS